MDERGRQPDNCEAQTRARALELAAGGMAEGEIFATLVREGLFPGDHLPDIVREAVSKLQAKQLACPGVFQEELVTKLQTVQTVPTVLTGHACSIMSKQDLFEVDASSVDAGSDAQPGPGTSRQAQPGSSTPNQDPASATTPNQAQTRLLRRERAAAMARGKTVIAQARCWLQVFREDLLEIPEWQVHFTLARILRNVTDRDPEQFYQLLLEWLPGVRRSPRFEDVYYSLLDAWNDVVFPAGQDSLDVAMERARQRPQIFTPYVGPTYQLIANFALYCDALADDGIIYLPRERLGRELGMAPRSVTSLVNRLEQYRVVECVDPNYSHAEGRAKSYRFIAGDEQLKLRTYREAGQ